jgi:hypothetical protein
LLQPDDIVRSTNTAINEWMAAEHLGSWYGTVVGLGSTPLLAVGLSPLLLSGSAQAVTTSATVSFSGQNLNYQAAGGQSNHLTVTTSEEALANDGSGYGTSKYTYILDDSVTIQADADRCTYPTSSDQTLVVCTWIVEAGQDPAYVAMFTLGDKNDTVTFVNPSEDTYGADEFYLGTGSDTSTKYLDGSRVVGDAGNDKITIDQLAGDLSGVQGCTGNDTLRVKNGDQQSINGDAGTQYPGRDVVKQS